LVERDAHLNFSLTTIPRFKPQLDPKQWRKSVPALVACLVAITLCFIANHVLFAHWHLEVIPAVIDLAYL